MTNETESEVPANGIAAATMLGDLMALVVNELKAAPDVWQKLGENEQDEVIERCRKQCSAAVEECVRLIATQGFSRIKAKLDSITVKDGIKAVMTISQHDAHRHDLVDAQGASLYLVLADVEQFTGGSSAVKAEPNQQALLLGELDKIARESKNDDGDLGLEGAA